MIDQEARQAFHDDALRIFAIAWQHGQRRYAHRHGFTAMALPALPRTEPIRVPTLREAIRGLFMEVAEYYLRCAEILHERMPPAISSQLLILHSAINDSGARVEILRNAVTFFANDESSLNSPGVVQAIKAARLALMAQQDTAGRVPAVQQGSTGWLL